MGREGCPYHKRLPGPRSARQKQSDTKVLGVAVLQRVELSQADYSCVLALEKNKFVGLGCVG